MAQPPVTRPTTPFACSNTTGSGSWGRGWGEVSLVVSFLDFVQRPNGILIIVAVVVAPIRPYGVMISDSVGINLSPR